MFFHTTPNQYLELYHYVYKFLNDAVHLQFYVDIIFVCATADTILSIQKYRLIKCIPVAMASFPLDIKHTFLLYFSLFTPITCLLRSIIKYQLYYISQNVLLYRLLT